MRVTVITKNDVMYYTVQDATVKEKEKEIILNDGKERWSIEINEIYRYILMDGILVLRNGGDE